MKRLMLCCLSLALFLPVLAAGQEADRLREIAASTRAEATNLLKEEAGALKVPVSGEAVFLDAQESSAAILPVAGIESLTRESLADWTTIGVISVAGPADAESPSGSFSVRVKAAPGSTRGQFQIVDAAGNVVQEGELSIEDAPAEEAGAQAKAFPMSPVTGKKGVLDSTTSAFHFPACYYPYAPYFRIYPYYYYGCHWWWYKWHWGHLRFRYCWWPYHGCCWWWRCC